MHQSLRVDVLVDPATAPELCLTLHGVQPQLRGLRIVELARLGHLMASLSEIGLNKDGLRGYLSELTGAMDELQDIVAEATEQFRARRTNTDVGRRGEEFVRARLQEVYASYGDQFEVWSGSGHQGDIRATIGHQSDKTILIEVKNQTRGPSASELRRFQQDVRDQPQVLGAIIVSLQSTIPGMKSPIDIVDVDGRPVFYVSQGTASEQQFIMAWGLMREWILRRGSDDGRASLVETIARLSSRRILAEVVALEEEARSDANRLASMRRSASNIERAAAELRREADSLEASIGLRARALTRFLRLESQSLESGERADLDAPALSQTAFEDALERNECAWQNHGPTLDALYRTLCRYDGIDINWWTGGFDVFRNNSFRFNVQILKTLVRIEFVPEFLPTPEEDESPQWEGGVVGRLKYKPRRSSILDTLTIMQVLDASSD